MSEDHIFSSLFPALDGFGLENDFVDLLVENGINVDNTVTGGLPWPGDVQDRGQYGDHSTDIDAYENKYSHSDEDIHLVGVATMEVLDRCMECDESVTASHPGVPGPLDGLEPAEQPPLPLDGTIQETIISMLLIWQTMRQTYGDNAKLEKAWNVGMAAFSNAFHGTLSAMSSGEDLGVVLAATTLINPIAEDPVIGTSCHTLDLSQECKPPIDHTYCIEAKVVEDENVAAEIKVESDPQLSEISVRVIGIKKEDGVATPKAEGCNGEIKALPSPASTQPGSSVKKPEPLNDPSKETSVGSRNDENDCPKPGPSSVRPKRAVVKRCFADEMPVKKKRKMKKEEDEEEAEEEKKKKIGRPRTSFPKADGRFYCPVEDCGRNYAANSNLSRHIHQHGPTNDCGVCGKIFQRGDYLSNHLRNETIKPKYHLPSEI